MFDKVTEQEAFMLARVAGTGFSREINPNLQEKRLPLGHTPQLHT